MTGRKSKTNTRGFTLLLPLALSALGIILVCAGFLQGDALSVLRKAVLICYECIGIG